MNVLLCPSRQELALFSAGRLEESTASELATHLDACETCRTTMEEISNSSDPLAASLRHGAPVPFSQEAGFQKALAFVQEIGVDASRSPAAGKLPPGIPANLTAIRDYEILEKLGEGGMGAVYKARHARLKKIVAIKVLTSDRMKDAHAVARFSREMEAVGKLEHPNLVRAMDAGEQEGIHYLVMEYVAGSDLSQLVRQQGQLHIGDACELIRQTALGLQSAHEHGLVHRDIKPSNLILSTTGTLKILDLGLALLGSEAGGGRELTTTGQMMGTLDYMAPEQGSSSHTVDIRADIYSLGATLYKLLTGQAPFGGEKYVTPVQKMMALATETPAPVESLRPDLPPDLADIVTKMLARNPASRYSTPAEVAEALQPHCRPLQCRPSFQDVPGIDFAPPKTSSTDKHLASSMTGTHASTPQSRPSFQDGQEPTLPTLKAVSPKVITPAPRPLPARLGKTAYIPAYIAAAIALLLLAGGGIYYGITILIKNKEGKVIGKLELEEGTKAEIQQDGKTIATVNPPDTDPSSKLPAAGKSGTSPVAPNSIFDALRREDIPAYELAVAGDGNPAKAPAEIVAILGDSRMRHSHTVNAVAFLGEDKLASASHDGTVKVWNTTSGEQLQVLRHPHNMAITKISYCAADNLLMTSSYADVRIQFWNMASGSVQREMGGIYCRMSGDGRRLALDRNPNKADGVAIVDSQTGETTRVIDDEQEWFFNLSSDGRLLATAGKDHAIRIWNADTGERLHTFPFTERIINGTFSPSGTLFATRHLSGTKVFDLTTETESIVSNVGNHGHGLAFSLDGKHLAYYHHENSAPGLELWNLGEKKSDWRTNNAQDIHCIAFSPNGKMIATGDAFGDVCLWDAETGIERRASNSPFTKTFMDVNAAGMVAVANGYSGVSALKAQLWDLSTQKLLHTLDPETDVCSVVFHPGGSLLAMGLGQYGKAPSRVTLWDVATGKLQSTLPAQPTEVNYLAFAADGRSFAAGSQYQADIHIWDWQSVQGLQTDDVVAPKAKFAGAGAIALDAKGGFLAAGGITPNGFGTGITLWDVKKGKPKWTHPLEATGNVHSLVFRPDGGLLASAGEQTSFWDSGTGEDYRRFKTPPYAHVSVAFSPNGQLVAVLDDAGEIHLFDPIIQVGVTPLRWTFHSRGVIKDIKFAADGRHLVTRNGNGTVYVLRLPGELLK
ncbi:MAG: protein kinase domain-containing protein [Pirellulaceae bacterium]